MARGWESKSIESQMETAEARRAAFARRDVKTAQQIEIEHKRDALLLSRTRVLHDLQAACNPRYRGQLEQALAYLDGQLRELPAPHE